MKIPEFVSKPLRLGNHISLLEGKFPENEKLAIGIDPGINFGMTIINRDYVSVYYGKLPTSKTPGVRGIEAYRFIMKSSLKTLRFTALEVMETFHAIVEGASYNSKYGQVALEEVRFGFFFALHELGFDARIVPPATIRKGAFNSGKRQAGDIWPSMNQNAADSIGCALYGITI